MAIQRNVQHAIDRDEGVLRALIERPYSSGTVGGIDIPGASAFNMGSRTNGNLKSKIPKFQIGPPERPAVLIEAAHIAVQFEISGFWI
jgi:hypothetical protein